MTLGIFDSGLGGEIVAKQLRAYFPDATFQVVNDRTHMPYGDRTQSDIYELTKRAIAPLLGCDVLVLACNTATAAAIEQLRIDFPNQKFVGYEPMVKPATQRTKTGKVIILATAATVASRRFQRLVATYADGIKIITPNTTNWARTIEMGEADAIDLGEVSHAIDDGADVVALACTHYIAIEQKIRDLSSVVEIIEPTPAVAARIKTLVSQPQQ